MCYVFIGWSLYFVQNAEMVVGEMTFNERVNAKQDYLNETDDAILIYIREHMKEISTLTIQKMSQNLFVAPNSIMRFAKKLGYSGFSELKFAIQNEFHPSDKVTLGRQLMDMLPGNIVKTLDLVDMEQVELAAKVIHESNCCILVGVGDSNYYCELLGKNLRCVDCNVQYHIQIHDMIYAVEHGKPEDVVLVISARGQNRRLVELAKRAKEKGMRTISITHMADNPLASVCDYNLYFWGENRMVQGYNVTDRIGLMILIRLISEIFWKKYSFPEE